MNTERPISRREFYAAITGTFALLLAVLSVASSGVEWQRTGLSIVCALGFVVYAVLMLRARRRGGGASSQ
jgi:type IV secretory pathway VirB2 component (pilin)